MPKQPDLPWTKREIIDVVISTYVPARVDEPETSAFSTMMTAFMGLALGRPEGRLAPYIEQETARLHHAARRRCGDFAARGASAADGDAGGRVCRPHFYPEFCQTIVSLSQGTGRNRLR